MSERGGDARFHVDTETDPSSTVIAGFSQYGLAGLTAVDYLVDHLKLEETGHIRAEGIPTITPFENGRPRHPTRLFSRDDLDVTVLVGEQAVPAAMAEPFSTAVLEWTEDADVDEVAVLSGVPFAHGPDEHRAFYIASEDYRTAHFPGTAPPGAPDVGEEGPLADDGEAAASDPDADGPVVEESPDPPADANRAEEAVGPAVPPMANGFLDGTNAALMARAMESTLGVCVYVTPVHAQAPDVEAAVRLVEAVDSVYGLDVDTGPLESFAAEVGNYYRSLAERLEEQADEEQSGDRMYM